MLGIPTTCSICGVTAVKYGCPSWSDVCVDAEACRDRLLDQNRALARQLAKASAGKPDAAEQ